MIDSSHSRIPVWKDPFGDIYDAIHEAIEEARAVSG
jgi:hypothetical protein